MTKDLKDKSLFELIKMLRIPQIWVVGTSLVTLISGSFGLGTYMGGFNKERVCIKDVDTLKSDRDTIRSAKIKVEEQLLECKSDVLNLKNSKCISKMDRKVIVEALQQYEEHITKIHKESKRKKK